MRELQTIDEGVLRKAKKNVETILPVPGDEVFQSFNKSGGYRPEELEKIRSKYREISQVLVSRLVFPALPEKIEERVVISLGITKKELADIRQICLRTEMNGGEEFEAFNERLKAVISKAFPKISKEKVGELLAKIEQATNVDTQEVVFDMISEQLKGMEPYIINRSILEFDLEKKEMLDTKTGALNEKGLEERFHLEAVKLNRQETEETEETEKKCMVIYEFDINSFKLINDDPQRGHAVGDDVIKEVVAELKKMLRPGDVVGRRGGDEFSVIATDVLISEVSAVTQKILLAIENISDRNGGRISITGSFRKIIKGDRVNYKEITESLDETGGIAKVLHEGELIEFPLNIKIDAKDKKTKELLAKAVARRKIKREKNKYLLKLEQTDVKTPEGLSESKLLYQMLGLIDSKEDILVGQELTSMELKEGIYKDIIV